MSCAVSRHRTLQNLFNKRPSLGQGSFVAPSASLIGDVKVGSNASVWYGSIVRGKAFSAGLRFLDNVSMQNDLLDESCMGLHMTNLPPGLGLDCNQINLGKVSLRPYLQFSTVCTSLALAVWQVNGAHIFGSMQDVHAWYCLSALRSQSA